MQPPAFTYHCCSMGPLPSFGIFLCSIRDLPAIPREVAVCDRRSMRHSGLTRLYLCTGTRSNAASAARAVKSTLFSGGPACAVNVRLLCRAPLRASRPESGVRDRESEPRFRCPEWWRLNHLNLAVKRPRLLMTVWQLPSTWSTTNPNRPSPVSTSISARSRRSRALVEVLAQPDIRHQLPRTLAIACRWRGQCPGASAQCTPG